MNGVEDADGSLIPLRNGDDWCLEIDLHTGIIKDWPQGVTASVHYKVCDDGEYYLKDQSGKRVAKEVNYYVPNYLLPGEYGDYIIMNIDECGKIKEWPTNLDFKGFELLKPKA